MRDCTQPAQEARYQISTFLQTGRQHSKIVRYGNVLAARFQISYSQESNHRLYLRVESAPQGNAIYYLTLPSYMLRFSKLLAVTLAFCGVPSLSFGPCRGHLVFSADCCFGDYYGNASYTLLF